MAGRSGSTSLSVISVCCGLARERADRKAAEAGVAYWLLPRENPEEGESDGCPVPMGVATCRAVSETNPPTGPKRDRYGEGIERGVIGPPGGAALLAKLASGRYFIFASSLFANGRRPLGEAMERGFRFNRRSRNR